MVIASLIFLALVIGTTEHCLYASCQQSSLEAANVAVEQAFNEIVAAERTGANVTDLESQLKHCHKPLGFKLRLPT
jgi:hypothetical protein